MLELVRVDAKRAYDQIRERITTLVLAPGSALSEPELARDLHVALAAVQEALRLLAHEGLVVIAPRHGLYVADVSVKELRQLSELRLSLEMLSARLAAERAVEDDLSVLDALRKEQATTPPADSRRLLEVDHRFHQAIAKATRNKYLDEALERLFGLSQRLWYLALPQLGFLPTAVEQHLELAEAIRARDPGRAEMLMRQHVQEFYQRVSAVLGTEEVRV